MNEFDRIAKIQKAIDDEQLDHAMEGYADQAATAHPALQLNHDFNDALEAGYFMRALECVRTARKVDGDEYLDVIRVLECAATKRLLTFMRRTPNVGIA